MTFISGRGPDDAVLTGDAQKKQLFDQREDHLRSLTGEVLRDLARNDSAPHEWRRAALEMMIEKHTKFVNHPDLAPLLAEIKLAEEEARQEARTEVESIIESVIEQPLQEPYPVPVPVLTPAGPFKASVTTQSLQDDVVDNR